MTVFPVVGRELRVASRRPWTYWSRLVAVGVGLMICSWFLMVRGGIGIQVTGEPVFYVASAMALGFGLLAGLLFSADSVSSEKRDGTLGLLFLTDLKGYDVTLGKLAATSLGAFYGLIAVMPLLALSLLMGGVTLADYGRMVAVLVITQFSSLALGLLASVLTSDVRRSVLVAFLLVVVLSFGAPLMNASVSWIMTQLGVSATAVERWDQNWLSNASPFVAYVNSAEVNYLKSSANYRHALLFTGGVGLLALVVASLVLPLVWQDKASSAPGWFWSRWLNRLRFWRPTSRIEFRRELLNRSPVTWLSSRHWIRDWLVWGFLGGTLLVIYLFFMFLPQEVLWEPELGLLVGIIFHLVLKYWMANEAPRQFYDDRRSGALELLLSTSLSIEDLLAGRWLSLRRQFLGPMLAVLLLDFFWLWALVRSSGATGAPEILWMGLAYMSVLLVDLWALAWDGLWSGLSSTSRAVASGLIGRILVLPWVVWLMGMAAYSFFGMMGGFRDILPEPTLAFSLGSWWGLAVLNSVFWALRARLQLTSRFREVATEPVAARRWFAWFRPKL